MTNRISNKYVFVLNPVHSHEFINGEDVLSYWNYMSIYTTSFASIKTCVPFYCNSDFIEVVCFETMKNKHVKWVLIHFFLGDIPIQTPT